MFVSLVDHSRTQQMANRILLLLMDQSKGSIRSSELATMYQTVYGYRINMQEVLNQLTGVIKVCIIKKSET